MSPRIKPRPDTGSATQRAVRALLDEIRRPGDEPRDDEREGDDGTIELDDGAELGRRAS